MTSTPKTPEAAIAAYMAAQQAPVFQLDDLPADAVAQIAAHGCGYVIVRPQENPDVD